MNSRTNFRLQLQREQSIQEQQKMQSSVNSNTATTNNYNDNIEMADEACLSSPIRVTNSSPMSIKVSSNSSGNNSHNAPKTLPVIISQPIRFSGNRLVHLPPQIIHVQTQNNFEDMGRKNMTLSSSLPPGFVQSSLAKTPKLTNESGNRVGTPQQMFFPQQVLSSSKQSSAELSPAGYTDSPRSASFASAQSELDDVIIDEILSMEEEQQRRKQHQQHPSSHHNNSPDKLASSLSYADDLEGLLTDGRTAGSNSYQRQVSNSAPSTTVDIEGLVRDELIREQELMRDRRKKDVHNMIERRRRYNINDRIKELGTLLPKSCTEEMKLNKGTILQASVEYILSLRKDHDRLVHMQHKQQTLEEENRRMVKRIQDLENQLKANGAQILKEDSTNSGVNLNHIIVKSEPIDDVDNESSSPTSQQTVYKNQISPLSNYQTQNISNSNVAQQNVSNLDYSPAMSGHSYAISSPEDQVSYYTSSGGYDPNGLLNDNNLVLMENRQIFNNDSSSVLHSLPVNLIQNTSSSLLLQNNNQMEELIMELGGGGGGAENVTSPGLLSNSDPMMSDTRLVNSQVSSPEIHWDSATFSPDGNDHMDFVAT